MLYVSIHKLQLAARRRQDRKDAGQKRRKHLNAGENRLFLQLVSQEIACVTMATLPAPLISAESAFFFKFSFISLISCCICPDLWALWSGCRDMVATHTDTHRHTHSVYEAFMGEEEFSYYWKTITVTQICRVPSCDLRTERMKGQSVEKVQDI